MRKNMATALLTLASVVGLASATAAGDKVALFEPTLVTRSAPNNGLSGGEVNIDKRWVFKEATVKVNCTDVGIGSVLTDNEDGTYAPPIVDNYMTAGSDYASICTGGSVISRSASTTISGTHCFVSAQYRVGQPVSPGYDSTGVSAKVSLAIGENDISFRLWDYGDVYGNSKLVLDLPGSCSGSAVGSPATDFYTVTPCRVFDTRELTGPTLGAPLACGSVRTFMVAGECGVPASATAVSLNVTGTGSTVQGNLRLFAGGTLVPVVSTLNYATGQTRANNAVTALGTGGQISVLCSPSGATHVVLDVNGYFE
jgi:hypothetical protein